jgi:isochorismate pyruvate lyase
MDKIRQEIDRIDEELVKLIAKRQRCVERAVAIKMRDGIPARVPERISEVIGNARARALTHHADPALIERLWTEMVEWFVAYEEKSLKPK